MHSYHRPRRIQYAFGLFFVAFGGLVRAQEPATNQSELTQCNSPLTPAPCPLLQSMMSTCAEADGQTYVLLNLASVPLGKYPGPEANTTSLDQCQCTEVGYNLFSACAACQINDPSHWLSRDDWFSRCMAKSDPAQIAVSPSGMAPENNTLWMTQKYNPTFSPSEALQVQTSNTSLPTTPEPQATETTSAESGNPSGNPSGNHSATVAGSAASSNQNPLGSTTNTTPIIVGAVVGAFALLAIIALGIFFLRRRQKQRTAPSAEFMKYSQVNAGSAREPLRAHSRANTADEDMHMMMGQGQGQGQGMGGYTRHSAIRLDSAGSGEDGGDIEMNEGGTNPPPFTTGLFKDPIFEKGVALNLAAAANSSGVAAGGGGESGLYGSSPITYSPATPSTQAHIATQFSERHGLIHGKQETL